MRQPVIRLADSRAAASATFVYQFNWQPRRADRDLGAFHAIDLPFVFDTFDVDGWDTFLGADDTARQVALAMRSAWAAFAATGDPSCAALGTWPRYSAPQRSTMLLDAPAGIVHDPLRAPRQLWSDLWDPACRPAGVPH